MTTRRARQILACEDGLRVDRNGPCAEEARENAALQQLIANALEGGESEITHGDFITVSRPSGKREYVVMVARLLAAPSESVAGDLALVIYISDPEIERRSITDALESLYSLTHSEAHLVTLLSMGLTLEEAAKSVGGGRRSRRASPW